ncbi:MAG TPA: hypothetical protein VK390_16685, partial [Propionibacteriaceae bacterium]|nr:hypothetical protein [Propionibacteriaceae bacterium]
MQGRQLLAGSGDVTLRGQHQPGPAADVRARLAGTRRCSHARTPYDDEEDTQEQCNATPERGGGGERKDPSGAQADGSPLAIVLGSVLDG